MATNQNEKPNPMKEFWLEQQRKVTDKNKVLGAPKQENIPYIELNMSSDGEILRSKAYPESDLEAAILFKIDAYKFDEFGNKSMIFANKYNVSDLFDYNKFDRNSANTIRHESSRNFGGNKTLDWERIIIGRAKESEFKQKKKYSEFQNHPKTPTFEHGAIEVDKGTGWVMIHYVQNLSNTTDCWGIADGYENIDRIYFQNTDLNIKLLIDTFLEIYDKNKSAYIKFNTHKKNDRTYKNITG